jgi:hypothetical protein
LADRCQTSLVEVGDVFGQRPTQVAFTEDERSSRAAGFRHAAFEPDAAWAGLQGSAQTCPKMTTDLGFDIDDAFSTVHRRFAFARLSETHHSGIRSRLFCNAHHHRS